MTFEEFKVGKSEYKVQNTFEKDGFYNILRDRVRSKFGNGKSLTNKIKYNNSWLFKISILFILQIISYY